MEDGKKVPRHIAIILDGNGRWAKKRGLPRSMGHKQGAQVVDQTIRDCRDLGVEYLTLYCFSTENWKRSMEEVDALMSLFRYYVKYVLKFAHEGQVRFIAIGDRSRFPQDLIESLDRLETETQDYRRMTVFLALNYGSRDEMIRAIRNMAEEIKAGTLTPEAITEESFSRHLDTRGVPDPDLLIRTSGELRLSNFLLWQLAYTEFYITDVLWPDFNKEELLKAIDSFNHRERRYGGVISGK